MNDVRCPLNEAAHISTNQPGIAGPHGVLLYSEVEQCVSATSALLAQAGVSEGDRIAILLDRGWEILILMLGIIRAGAVVCPVNHRATKARLVTNLEQICCKWLVAPTARADVADELGVTLLAPEKLVGFVSKMEKSNSPHLPLSRMASIYLTSKRDITSAVAQSFGNHYYGARGANANLRLHSSDNWLIGEHAHNPAVVAGLFRCLLSGACLTFPGPGERMAEAIKKYKPSYASLEVGQLDKLLEEGFKVEDAEKLKALSVSGGPAPPPLLKKAQQSGFRVYSGYAIAEAAADVSATNDTSTAAERLTCGKVLKYRKMQIAADGEILVRGETVFHGYVKGEAVISALDEEGWFATGTHGRLDENECLVVTGKKKRK